MFKNFYKSKLIINPDRIRNLHISGGIHQLENIDTQVLDFLYLGKEVHAVPCSDEWNRILSYIN